MKTRQHRFLLRLYLDQIDALDAAVARIDAEVDGNLTSLDRLTKPSRLWDDRLLPTFG